MSFAFTPDGTRLFLYVANGNIKIFDTRNWTLLKTFNPAFSCQSMQFSPSGSTLCCCDSTNSIAALWDTKSLRKIREIKHVSNPDYTNDGRLWLIQDPAESYIRLEDEGRGHANSIPGKYSDYSDLPSTNGQFIYRSVRDAVDVSSTRTGQVVAVLKMQTSGLPITCALSDDGHALIAGSNGEANTAGRGVLFAWNAQTFRRIFRIDEHAAQNHGDADMSGIATSSDGKVLALTDVQNVTFWNCDTGRKISSIQAYDNNWFGFCPGTHLYCCSHLGGWFSVSRVK